MASGCAQRFIHGSKTLFLVLFYGWVPECACPSSPVQVRDVLKQNSKQLGTDLQITGFVRVQVGEGLEAEEKDFAKEVEETLKSVA